MIKNYFTIAWRNLVKSKGYSAINIGGLALGMAVAMLIALWIYDELSYNKYHKNYNHVARVMRQVTVNGEVFTGSYNPLPLSRKLRESFPGDFDRVATSSWTEEHVLAVGDNNFNVPGNFMELDGPAILSLEMIEGTRDGIKDINAVLLSETTAKKLFGNEEPINKIVKIDKGADLKVAGVYKDIPFNSEFKDVAFVSSFEFYHSWRPWMGKDDWENNHIQVLAQISPTAAFDKVTDKIKDIHPTNNIKDAGHVLTQYLLHPMSKWHLYEEFKAGINTGGRIQFVWLFGIIGVFVLLLACINFMNLSTARSAKRAKEIGIRKAIGSVRSQLINQFLSESLLVSILAFLLSLGIVQLTLPWFNQVAGKQINILWTEPSFWLLSVAFTFFTGLIAGSYPAFYLSSFQPVKVLKGVFRAGRLAAIPRKALVVVQFSVSVILIIGTVIVYRQVQFAKNRSAGYNSDQLIYVTMKTNDLHDHYDAMKADLLSTGVVREVGESSGFLLRNGANFGGYEWKGKDPNFTESFAVEWVNHDYGKTVGWQFVDGRDFNIGIASDSAAYIINEAAAKYMNLQNPVGEIVRYNNAPFKIIGVIKDVIAESPYKAVRPTIASILQWPGNTTYIKLNNKASMDQALAKVDKVIKKFATGMPIEYKFVDQEYARKFDAEIRVGTLSGFFSILAILISCMGLFGLASFVAEQRTKEIGIRKVLGASVINLWELLSREFVVLVIVSCFIATPVAYYLLHNWLQNYDYRTDISWWIFAVSIGGALLIAILTVSFQAIKAAIANPVKSLRNE